RRPGAELERDGGQPVVQVAVTAAGQRRGAARAALVDEARDRVAPHSTGMLMDVDAGVVVRILRFRRQLDGGVAQLRLQALPLLGMVGLQPVTSGVFEALQMPLEPAVVLVENTFF